MILCFTVALPVYAELFDECGTIVEKYDYKFNAETGHLTIGKSIENKKIEDIVPVYKNEIKTVTINDGVTSICSQAFAGCRRLTSILLFQIA